MSYFTKYGLLRMNKDIPVENGILFTAYHTMFSKLVWGVVEPKRINMAVAYTFSHKKSFFRANPPEDTDHFSHDNMKGLYYLVKKDERKHLPIIHWNDGYWLHPNGWSVFLATRNRVFNTLFYPLIAFLVWYSWAFSPKEDTSGKILWFLCCDMLEYNSLKAFALRKGVIYAFKHYITNGFNPEWENEDNPLYMLVSKYEEQIKK